MTTLSIELPDLLHQHAKKLASRGGVSLDQIIAMAIEKMTDAYLEERARSGSRQEYEAALSKVPDVEPDEYDRLPTR